MDSALALKQLITAMVKESYPDMPASTRKDVVDEVEDTFDGTIFNVVDGMIALTIEDDEDDDPEGEDGDDDDDDDEEEDEKEGADTVDAEVIDIGGKRRTA